MSDDFKPMDTKEKSSDFDFSNWVNTKPSKVKDEDKVPMITPQELEQLKQEAYQEGLQKGLLEGKEKIEQQLSFLKNYIQLIYHPLSLIDQQVLDELIEFSVWTAKQVIKKEIESSPELLPIIINEAVDMIPNNSKIQVLYLNREDLKELESIATSHDLSIDLSTCKSEDSLSRGEYRLLTDLSQIDSSVAQRIAELLEKSTTHTPQVPDE